MSPGLPPIMLYVTRNLQIPDDELRWQAIRASGPGGQNVNKVATAVQLFFDAQQSPSLTEPVRRRLLAQGGLQWSQEGVLVIKSESHRTQGANREEALERLRARLIAAATPPTPRLKTRPPRSAARERLEGKKIRSEVKSGRGRIRD